MSSELVSFKGGFVADLAVVRRLLELEGRGVTFNLLDNDRFKVDPPSTLTPDDIAWLRQRRDEARACIAYVERFDTKAGVCVTRR